MTKQKLLSGLLASFMVVSQLGWVNAAAAEESPSPTPSPTPTTEASASPSPAPSPEASPSPSASPDPSASPSASPEPTASASPSPSPEDSPEAKHKKKSTDVGPDGCGGTIPNWVFDTVSRTWVAADKNSFSCNKASGYYLSPKYYFDKRIGWYEIIPDTSTAAKPDYLITAPNVVHTVLGDLVVGSQDYQVAKAMGLLTTGGGGILAPDASSGVSGAGAASTSQVGTGGGAQSVFDLTNLVNVINTLQSNATSGNVNAASNTTVGNASTGAATVVANLINLLASAWSWSNGNLNFFMQTLLSPHTGDINLNPTQTATGGGGSMGGVSINGTGSGSNNTVDVNNPSSLNVNAKDSGNIVNNVDVNATSGNASASKNTVVGDVATGDAQAQVNIINLINSFINSGSSFFGILNIVGNLNGDILFPAGFLNGLVPSGSTAASVSGTGAGSNNQVGVDNSGAVSVNTAISKSVNNNITTNAASGSANVDANTSSGAVQTGVATTNQGVFNLANQSIFGDNAVLVMVNVLGHWLGKIMNLAGTGGSQSALLTGNAITAAVANTGANSTNQVNVNNAGNVDVNQQSAGTITNNVNVNAASGNADVTKNTKVGSVSTGNAQADSSVANLFNAVLDVRHWFGVLIINVFGDWTGDVNHDSSAGGFSTTLVTPAVAPAGGTAPQTSALPSVGLLAFVTPVTAVAGGSGSGADGSSQVGTGSAKVLTAAVHTTPTSATAAAQAKNMSFLFIISAVIMMIAGALITIDKKLNRRS